MKCVITTENHEEKIVDMTEELIKEFERKAEAWSGEYCNYVVEIGWDEYYELPYIGLNGPWEC